MKQANSKKQISEMTPLEIAVECLFLIHESSGRLRSSHIIELAQGYNLDIRQLTRIAYTVIYG